MAKLEIKIQIRKLLKPSTPTPNHLQSFNLSLIDQMTSTIYVPLLFYYLPSSELIKAENNTERCDKLQKSLAETLAKFYPLAGRCRKDRLSIHCNDEGVEYVEAKVNANLTNFLNDGPKIELLDDLLPWPVPPESYFPLSPLVGVQVNLFNCGGLVIATQISHIIADACSMATFLNEWAHISLTGGTSKGCLQSLDHLPSLFPPRVLEEHQFPPPPSRGANIVARRFVFDVLSIAKLQDRIDSGGAPGRVLLVMSLIWKVLMGISSAKHGRSRDSCSIIPMNMRGKSNIPSSENIALGNFCWVAFATLQANQPKDFNDYVNLLRSTLKDKSADIGKASIDDIRESFLQYHDTRVAHNPIQKDDIDTYFLSSWCRFPLYEVDFGWGKPFWVSTAGFPSGLVILIDTKNGDGIEAWVNLKENDMAEFERDPELLTFCHLHSIP